MKNYFLLALMLLYLLTFLPFKGLLKSDLSSDPRFQKLIGQTFEKKVSFSICEAGEKNNYWLVPTSFLQGSQPHFYTLVREVADEEVIKINKVLSHWSVDGGSGVYLYGSLLVNNKPTDIYLGLVLNDLEEGKKHYSALFENEYLKPK